MVKDEIRGENSSIENTALKGWKTEEAERASSRGRGESRDCGFMESKTGI